MAWASGEGVEQVMWDMSVVEVGSALTRRVSQYHRKLNTSFSPGSDAFYRAEVRQMEGEAHI